MAQISEQQVLEALSGVVDEEKNQDIVSLGMVSGLQVKQGHVAFALQVEPERGPRLEPLRKKAEQTVHALPGVLTATVVLTAERQAAAEPKPAPHAHDHGHGHGHQDEPLLPQVRAIVAVASGKGGVGKSTTAVNLALALAVRGLKVGVLDADIYGPSIPRMLGIKGQPTSSDGRSINPMRNHGVECMSIGFLVEEEMPIIWRGPMVMSALEQMMKDVRWSPLDIMVVDMPPGTGDAQLTMAQRVPLIGAVIVSTPQDIALADARKGLNMFRKVNVPVLGIVENMSYFACPHCGERTDIFSHGGARAEAELLGVDCLGEVPLDIVIRETSDGGNPIVVSDPASPHAKAYLDIADKVWVKVEAELAERERAAPRILVQ
ncbi:Mrp/NBP35 family ATP-binding protein [Shumkonia mesophila]|uniref:Mrp/NBP35 family ATP-binding protein n=1 Tax=Shumkonia mesophila TaxID=2838854 RepID=UPI002934B492|nr:Mrp/NBP35 family ATP-binding protein [Shumkonia mesophila]